MASQKKRVVILGAGFAGLTAIMELARLLHEDDNTEVVLVDRNPYHLFTPLLYQAATGEVEPGHIAYPIRWLMRRKTFQFYESGIHAIDLANKNIVLDKTELDYDFLAITLGSTTNFFGVPKAEQYALPLKTLREAMAIKYRIIESYSQAEWTTDEVVRRHLLSIAVVGGGATGVELVASMNDLVHSILSRDFPKINPAEVSLLVCEASPALLGGMDTGLAALALKKLQQSGIKVDCSTRIVGIEEGGLHTAQGITLPAHTVIWATGIRPSPLLEPLPIIKSKDGRAVVRETLRLPLWTGVYAAGDNAYFVEPGSERPLPCTAAVAAQEGKAMAVNIVRALKGQDQIPFRYKYEGNLVALGRNASLAKVAGRCFNSFPAWLLWRLVHLSKLPDVRNQVSVALDWTFDYLLRRDTMRLE
ncbi:MAG: NAD(P)/FAD-dependent oxidoreductase [Chloroflexi bacterium]|nr:NAD(P)/FAD-dependent oxidoreductase [Chloroflexota bacterium]